jgi:outer membrane protein OmpA-like peptidoglycan-associated protein
MFAAVLAVGISSAAFADDKVRGIITGRGADGTFTVETDDLSNIVVAIDDTTKVRRTDGLRTRKMSSSVLIPGLRVELHGTYDTPSHFAAKRVIFTRGDLKTARAIEGGIAATDQRSASNQQRLDQQGQALQQQGQTLEQQKQQLQLHKAQIAATSGALERTNARIANLDNYNVISAVTVYFANGKATIEPKYRTELEKLAAQAKDVDGYLIQVQGYASKVGGEAFNQQLSMKRADEVTSLLQQHGIILSNVVVPAAMGTTDQVASNKTAKGQAENRRAVVSLLQNKGISGK